MTHTGPQAIPSQIRKNRLKDSGPELDAAELDWWRQYADVEEEYCWVQTPAIQRFLRGRYLRGIAEAIPKSGRVLEIGCGTGWLAQLLAEYGASEVHALDFSPDQISRAKAQGSLRQSGGSVTYHLASAGDAVLPAALTHCRFNVFVMHAVLHHLSDREIRTLLEVFVIPLAAHDVQVFILEPVLYRAAHSPRSRLDGLVDRLILLPKAGRKLGLRRVSAAEAQLRHRIDHRGDSPKEAPFEPGELEAIVHPQLHVTEAQPVLCFSFLAAKNILLLLESHPFIGRLLIWPYLSLVRLLERRLLKLAPGSIWLPLFVLFKATVTPRPALDP